MLSNSALIEFTEDWLRDEFKLRSAEAQGPHVEEVNISLRTRFLIVDIIISVVDEISELVAVIFATPLDFAITFPSWSIDATPSFEEDQSTESLSSLLPSLSKPRA